MDIWLNVYDGGLLLMLPYILRRHVTWKDAKIRLAALPPFTNRRCASPLLLFTVAHAHCCAAMGRLSRSLFVRHITTTRWP